MCAEEALAGVEGSLVVLSGDTPLLRPETIRALVSAREEAGAAAALLTAELDDATGYGRIVRDADGNVTDIVEHKDLAADQVDIAEVNTGTYCFDTRLLMEHLTHLDTDNAQGEFYLTDMVRVFRSEGHTVVSASTDEPAETLGVNSRVQLAEATSHLQRRINEAHMLAGVTMTAPELVWIGAHVRIERDVVLDPMTFLMGETGIGEGAHLGPNSRVTDSVIGAGAVVDSSIVLEATVGEGANVGPVAYLRPGTVLEANAKAGTSVEIKNSTVGEGSKVPHLSYIGDATIGTGVNVGAGTITCNYDGSSKHPTVIEDDVFIGSDTMLIAPVRIGKGAVTGAASAINHDVPAGALGIERNDQRVVDGWAERKRSSDAQEADDGKASE
jgi:bifunctional UDP-N-acetylglucosamine pyrophosphorylase/glucosamine-1-phosphate N-acetyltransferase